MKMPAGLKQVGEVGPDLRAGISREGQPPCRPIPSFSVLLESKMWIRSADDDENIKMRLAKLSRIRTLKETQL
jgi:hypothetical protein